MISIKWLLALAMAVVVSLGISGPAFSDGIPLAAVLVEKADQYAFFGWYGAFEYPPAAGEPWTKLVDLVKQDTSNGAPASTHLLIFTADGSSNPDHAGNLDAGTLYNRFVGEGYLVDVASQTSILSMTDYSKYALVLYPNLDDHSAANVVASGVPFITMEPGQTDEMNIGSGVSVFNGFADTFQIVGGGALMFDNPVRTEAIGAAGDGVVVVEMEAIPEPTTMVMVLTGATSLVGWLRRRKQVRIGGQV